MYPDLYVRRKLVAPREEATSAKKGNLQKEGAKHHGLSKVMSNLESKN